MPRQLVIPLLSLLVCLGASAAHADAARQVPPELTRVELYSQLDSVQGITIRSMPAVSAEAVEIAKVRLAMLLEHLPEVAANLAAGGAELRIMTGHPDVDVTGGLICYATEENILKNERDRFSDHRDICVHECSHMLNLAGFSVEQTTAIHTRYETVKAEGLWPGAYALTNENEFFAELAMWYFGTRGDYGSIEPPPQEGSQWLKAYDPESYELLDAIFSGRIASERWEWSTLSDQSAEDGKLRSEAGSEPALIVIQNRLDDALRVQWVDYLGQAIDYGVIAAGDKWSTSTFVSHPWRLVREDGSLAAIYVTSGAHSRASVEPIRSKD